MNLLFKNIDQYCERTDFFWASEPLNLFSNLFFILVGLYWLTKYKQAKLSFLFPLLGVSMGLGSSLFHSFANVLTMWADIIPIATFAILYLYFLLKFALRISYAHLLYWFLLMGVGGAASTFLFSGHVNGSEAYFILPVLLLLLAKIYATRLGRLSRLRLASAGGWLCVSLFFRTIDAGVCEHLPIGTHYFWHLFNALVIHLLLSVYCQQMLLQRESKSKS